MPGWLRTLRQRAGEKSAADERAPPKYDYKPLEPGCIRVLDLLSQPGQSLRCRLRHVALDAQPPYVALSYVWGDPDQPFSMEVVGDQGEEGVAGSIALTTSLQNALQNLRDCRHFQESRTFWIDQICINQANDVEKSHQVARMRHIYETASEVVTCLGAEGPGDEEAVSLLRRIYHFYGDKMRLQTDDPSLREIHSRLRDYYLDCMSHKFTYAADEDIPSELRFDFGAGDADLAAYSHLAEAIVSTPWNQRIWLVQENVMNQRAGFLRGPCYMAWDSVGLLCALSVVGLLPFVPDAAEVLDVRLLRLRVFQIGLNPDAFDTLYNTMYRFRFRECTDTRDRIYAVLGLASDAEDLGVLPEYDKCPAQVFTDVAVKHVRKAIRENADDELMVLTWVGIKSSPDGLDPLFPSWVPTFSSVINFQSTPATQHASRRSRRFLPSGAPASFQSTESIENAILVAEGIRLEPLAVEFGSFDDTSLNSLMRTSDLDHIVTVLDSMVARLGDGDETCASMCQTLLMNGAWPPRPETRTRDAADAFRDLRRVLDLAARDGLRIKSRDHGPDFFFLPTSTPEVSEPAAHVIKNIHAMNDRALWLTDGGDMVLAPASARPGDVPVVLFGGRWIYFLRPSVDLFEYMGWGYVHGFANGEVFETEGWEERVEAFRIR